MVKAEGTSFIEANPVVVTAPPTGPITVTLKDRMSFRVEDIATIELWTPSNIASQTTTVRTDLVVVELNTGSRHTLLIPPHADIDASMVDAYQRLQWVMREQEHRMVWIITDKGDVNQEPNPDPNP